MAWTMITSSDVVDNKAEFTVNKLGGYALKKTVDEPPTVEILENKGLYFTDYSSSPYWDLDLIPTVGMQYVFKTRLSTSPAAREILVGSTSNDYSCGYSLGNYTNFQSCTAGELIISSYGTEWYELLATLTPSQNGTQPLHLEGNNNNGTHVRCLTICAYNNITATNNGEDFANLQAARTTSVGDVYIGAQKQTERCAAGTLGFWDSVRNRFYIPYITSGSVTYRDI